MWEQFVGRDLVKLVWRETGGPTVCPPTQKGFGSHLIERAFGGQLGTTQLVFSPEGLCCTLDGSDRTRPRMRASCGRSSYLGSDLCKFHGPRESDVRYGSLADLAHALPNVRLVPTADVRRRPPDFRQVDLELSSLPGGL